MLHSLRAARRAALLYSLALLVTGAVLLPAAGATGSAPVVAMGEDERQCGGRDVDVFGGAGPDRIVGNDRNNVFAGGRGADVLRGNDGDDRLCGGQGPDRLLGGDDDDRLYGGPGRDVLNGGPGRDECVGSGGGDVIRNCER